MNFGSSTMDRLTLEDRHGKMDLDHTEAMPGKTEETAIQGAYTRQPATPRLNASLHGRIDPIRMLLSKASTRAGFQIAEVEG